MSTATTVIVIGSAGFIGAMLGVLGITPRDLWDVACYVLDRFRGRA